VRILHQRESWLPARGQPTMGGCDPKKLSRNCVLARYFGIEGMRRSAGTAASLAQFDISEGCNLESTTGRLLALSIYATAAPG